MALATSPGRQKGLGVLAAALLLCVSTALGGEGGGLFGEPPPESGEKKPVPRAPEPEVRVPEVPDGPRHFYRPLWASFDLHYRRRKIRPVKVRDEFHDNVGDVHFDERLDMDLYRSKDVFQSLTLGLSLHYKPIRTLDVYAGVRWLTYAKADHNNLEYDEAPIASPELELDHEASIELAGGFGWEFLRARGGPLRHFGLWLGAEYRIGWADEIECRNEEEEFDVDGDDDIEYDADWWALDAELRVFRVFEDTIDGTITVYVGGGASVFFYHEEWDGEFEGGDEEEKLEFDYREQNTFFGSVGIRAEKGPIVAEVTARYGGEYLVHAVLGYKF